MKIVKVVYELFESDYSRILGHENDNSHEIDREVRLITDDGANIYVSWANEPIQFSVGYKDSSWNINKPEREIEASHWNMWKPIIRQECKLVYVNKEHQILELKSSGGSIYFSSQEQGCWESDVLHISTNRPKYSSKHDSPTDAKKRCG